MNIIGSLSAVSTILAVGISFAPADMVMPKAEKTNAPTKAAIMNSSGLTTVPALSRTDPDAVTSESKIPKAEPARHLPKIMFRVDRGAD